jgi:hypothetical protein
VLSLYEMLNNKDSNDFSNLDCCNGCTRHNSADNPAKGAVWADIEKCWTNSWRK